MVFRRKILLVFGLGVAIIILQMFAINVLSSQPPSQLPWMEEAANEKVRGSTVRPSLQHVSLKNIHVLEIHELKWILIQKVDLQHKIAISPAWIYSYVAFAYFVVLVLLFCTTPWGTLFYRPPWLIGVIQDVQLLYATQYVEAQPEQMLYCSMYGQGSGWVWLTAWLFAIKQWSSLNGDL